MEQVLLKREKKSLFEKIKEDINCLQEKENSEYFIIKSLGF